METLAYLQIAQDFEDPENKEFVFLKDGLAMFKSVSRLKLPSQTLFILLGVASSAFAWNLASSAQAIVLQEGDSGSDVSYLQNLLNQEGYSVPVTGYYGSQTGTQVANFQYDSNLTADGVAGDSTFAALEGGFVALQPDTGTGSGTAGLLRQGDSGSTVTEVQNLLYNKGYFNGASTGYFGSATTSAVVAFQSDYGLSADGVVGSATLAALRGNGGLVPIGPDPSSSGTLSYGASGSAVRNLQTLLNSKGYSVSVDGSFGSTTEQQLKNFQYDNYLSVDGVAGSATLAALQSGYRAVKPGSSTDGYSYLYGDTGSSVVSIQRFLRDQGYYTGSLDGIYGSATYDAVARYQRAKGISADGIWGPQTAGA
jgi:peptidoglycan hydrolase-like protein with peptidoglycan-binding domain